VLSTTPLIPSTPALGPTLELTPMPGSSGGMSLSGVGSGATTYKIQKGDMLGTIAKKFGVTAKALEAANPGIDSTRLKIDAVIKIPAGTATASTKPAVTTPGTATARTTVAAGKPVTTGTAGATTIKPGTTYMVKKGDTLSTIAKAAYGTKGSWKKLYQANKTLTDPDVVPVGTQIVIP
jgi:LysM repeat protein